MYMRLLVPVIAGVCFFAAWGFGCAFLPQPYSGAPSDHFDGRRFHNQDRAAEQTFGNFLKWIISRNQGVWREHDGQFITGPKPPERIGRGELRVTFVNHATFLIQMDGLNILTDPIWSERASPFAFTGPRRAHPPGLAFDDLPRIDLVLVTHNHYDHLDINSLKKTARRDDPAVVTTLGNRKLLRQQGFTRVTELDWWQQMPVSESVRITCVPAQHFSGRGLFDSYKTLWAGFVLESDAGAVFFAGDTGLGPHFKQIAERFKNIRLALLPIGAFRPEWFMTFGHLAPADALQAHFILNARTSVAMHFGTFPLADDNQDDPVNKLHAAVAQADLQGTRFWVLDFGQGKDVPSLP